MEYDGPWKYAVETMFEECVALLFPRIARDIDFAQGHEFLDQELQQIAPESESGKRVVDKLVKVFLRDGSERWLLIHLEVQGYSDERFPERMYVYNYRSFDKFRRDVVSLAILIDDNPNFRPNEYRRAHWDFEVTCRYPIVKLLDFRERWQELEESSNPFALVVKAHLRTLETRGNEQARYSWKKHFLLELYRSGLHRETIVALYKFIDWLMQLPSGLNDQLFTEIEETKELIEMEYITTAERMGIKKTLPTIHQALAMAIDLKFGTTGQTLNERLYRVDDLYKLQFLTERLKLATNVAEVEKIFEELELKDWNEN